MATCKFCGKQSNRRARRCIACSQTIEGFRPGDLVETIPGTLKSGGTSGTSHWQNVYLAKVDSISRNRIFIRFEDVCNQINFLIAHGHTFDGDGGVRANCNNKEIRKISAERAEKYLFPSKALITSRMFGLAEPW